MKKSKLLIPALTVASVGAVVAPLMTMSSCSKVTASTDDIDYEGEQHAAVTGGLSIARATEEYYKDSKYFAQDTLGVFAHMFKTYFSIIESSYENAEITQFHASIKDLQVTPTEAKVESEYVPNPNKIKGALISGQFDVMFSYAYDDDLSIYESSSLLEKVRVETTVSMNMSINEGFAFLDWGFVRNLLDMSKSQSQFSYNLYGCKDASSNWSLNGALKFAEKSTFTTKAKDVFVEYSNSEDTITESAKKNVDTSMIGIGQFGANPEYATPSNYLSKVDWDCSDNLYLENVYTSDGSEKLEGYGRALTLVNGKTYTLCANVVSSLAIDTFNIEPYDATYEVPFTVKSCTLNGNDVACQTRALDTDPLKFSSPLSTGAFKITITVGGTKKAGSWISIKKAA